MNSPILTPATVTYKYDGSWANSGRATATTCSRRKADGFLVSGQSGSAEWFIAEDEVNGGWNAQEVERDDPNTKVRLLSRRITFRPSRKLLLASL